MINRFTSILSVTGLIWLGGLQSGLAQEVSGIHLPASSAAPASPADIRLVTVVSGKTPSETLITIGKSFIGKPYIHHTLDGNASEQLVVNFLAFDCTTFLETTLALALTAQQLPAQSETSPGRYDALFRHYLTKLRYRNGRIDGYGSRLHYFSDWLYDNERKGLLYDVTQVLGGVQVSKPVSYMTTRLVNYPPLQDPTVYRQVAQTETSISQQPFYFIPKKQIRTIEAQLREGDIVMLTASRPGLDMKHVGFVTWQNGRVHLLHASSDYGQVMITPFPLADYVNGNRGLSGIRVARLKTTTEPVTALIK